MTIFHIKHPFLHISAEVSFSVGFSIVDIYIHVFDMCFFGLSIRIQGTTFMLMLSSSISGSQMANFYF
jgi:hypothetical protein